MDSGRDSGGHSVGITGGHPIACKQGREGGPSTAPSRWPYSFVLTLSPWFALLVDCEALGAANSEQRSKEAGKDSAQIVASVVTCGLSSFFCVKSLEAKHAIPIVTA